MLQIILGTYLVFGLGAMLLLWVSLAAAGMHDANEGSERQREYRIVLAISHLRNARVRRTLELLEDQA